MPGYPGCTDVSGSIYFHSNRSCRLPPAHQGMKIEVLTGGGVCGSFATHTPPLDSRFRGTSSLDSGFRMIGRSHGKPSNTIFVPTNWGAILRENRTYTGTTYFRTNRPCRLLPAHRGMKSRSCGLVQRIGTADSATPHPDPSGGQAPALHLLIPPSTIGLQFGTFCPWKAGIEVDWRAHFRTNDEVGGRIDAAGRGDRDLPARREPSSCRADR